VDVLGSNLNLNREQFLEIDQTCIGDDDLLRAELYLFFEVSADDL
jgi:hypothetical protein